MKKYSLIAFIFIILLSITGCGKQDEPIGALIAFYNDESDISWDNIENIKVEVVENEEGLRVLKIEGIDAHGFIIDETKEKDKIEEYSSIGIADDGFVEVKKIDVGKIIEVDIKAYVDGATVGNVTVFNLHKKENGEIYIKEPSTGFHIPDDEDEQERQLGTFYLNNEEGTKSTRNKISIEIESILKSSDYNFIELSDKSEIINEQKFTSTNIPDEINIEKETEYIVVEKINNKKTNRKIVNLNDEEDILMIPTFDEGNIAKIKYIEFKK